MIEILMQFEGDEQIQLFLRSYPNAKELEDAFDLFHIHTKNIQKITVTRAEKSDRYVFQFHTRRGILCLEDNAVM